MVAHSHRDRIRSIGTGRQFLYVQNVVKHRRNLFLTGIPVSRNALFHTLGSIFHNGDILVQCCRDRYTLRASEFQHALDILSEELRFNSKLVRVMRCNYRGNMLKNSA